MNLPLFWHLIGIESYNQSMNLYVQLLILSIMFPKFNHIIARISTSFLFTPVYTIHCVDIPPFAYPFISWWTFELFPLVHAQVLQSCPTLCDHMDHSPQLPLSMGFSRQEYQSGLSCPLPGDFPNPGIEPVFPISPAVQAESLPAEPPRKPSFTLLAIMNNAATNICIQVLCGHRLSVLLVMSCWVIWQFFNFLRTCQVLPKTAVSFYISNSFFLKAMQN